MKFFILTLGCRLNQAESQELEDKLLSLGCQKAETPKEADLVVVNTCVVTRKAERETRKTLRRLRRENPKAKLIASGCWVNKVDQFGGIKVEEVDEMIKNEEKWEMAEGLTLNAQGGDIYKKIKQINGRALIKIQAGCHNQCTYCLPTLVRGPSISRSVDKVVKNVKEAVARGAVEVVLTGQNVSQYNDNGKTWINLVEAVLKETDIKLIRLGSVSPDLVERLSTSDGVTQSLLRGETGAQLVKLYQGVGKNRLARHLHLSLQSGSNRILKKMNRKYTTEQFTEVVDKLRQWVDGINITTDIIVGFPGETEDDFQRTLDFCREMKFGKIHIFRYSPRKGTLAFKKREEWGRVNSKIKKERSKKLHQLEKKLRCQFWQSQVGKTAVAKIWGNGDGLTDNYIPIRVNLEEKLTQPIVREIKLLAEPNFDILKPSRACSSGVRALIL
jgi:threonylcarbamoyladenosine tRNA methylthiotransferase MtaB